MTAEPTTQAASEADHPAVDLGSDLTISEAESKKIVLSRFVARRRLSQEVLEKLLEHFPGMILQTPVREASILAECPGVGRTVFEYRENSGSAEDFKMLAYDVMQGNTMS